MGNSLLLYLCLVVCHVHGNDVMNSFMASIIEDFRLITPTIIFGDEAPSFCMDVDLLLCLDNSQNEAALIAKHLETLHLTRKQDAVIFADGDGMSTLIKEISKIIPSLYRSPCPVFMHLDYVDMIELKLDSNILFYKTENDLGYKLLDIYAYKDGPLYTNEIGSWSETGGLELYASTNRWDRRNDMNGAVLINTLKYYKNFAEPSYDTEGNVVGSRGSRPDRLHAVAESLNFTVKTLMTFDGQFGKKLENGTWTGCVGMLTRNFADACTAGLAWTMIRYTAIDYTDALAIPTGRYTLIGPSSRKTVLDMWVYAGVFGFLPLVVFVGFLLIILVGLLLTSYFAYGTENNYVERTISGSGMLFMYVIQFGNHPEGGSNAVRIIYFTSAILTFLMFAYFTTVVTAEMTALASLENPIQSFDDVVENEDIQVIVVTGASWTSSLRRSSPGTAKYEVFKNRIENNDNAWFETADAAREAVLTNPNTYFYSHTTQAKTGPGFVALRMTDSTPVSGGIGLQQNGELLDILNYKMLKLAESGIIKRIDKMWPDVSRNEEFGVAEPGALGINNVLFPFTVLATGIVTAVASSFMEYIVRGRILKDGMNLDSKI